MWISMKKKIDSVWLGATNLDKEEKKNLYFLWNNKKYLSFLCNK